MIENRHCMLIGEAKCGTTSFYKYMIQHPLVIQPAYKELNYFTQRYSPNVGNYKTVLRSVNTSNIVTLDCSAQYFRTITEPDSVPERILKMVKNPYFVLLLRNPIDRLYSNYWMNLKRGSERYKDKTFEDMLEENFLDDTCNLYLKNLRRWCNYFPKEKFFIIKSEDFFNNPQKQMNHVFQFLDINLYRILDLEPAIPVTNKKRNYPQMKEETRKYLKKYFEPRNRLFYRYIDRDMGWK